MVYKKLIFYSLMILELVQMLSVFVEFLHAYRWTDGRTEQFY